MPAYPKNMTGQKFGRLTVIEESGRTPRGIATWKCICDCGKTVIVCGSDLRNGGTKSCGCLRRDVTTQRKTIHGLYYTRLHNIYQNMKARCYNRNHPHYKDYGGRGIGICPEWLNSLPAFYEWAVNHGYRDDLTIDRINNDGNYEPDNCRWATMKVQSNNRRPRKKKGA